MTRFAAATTAALLLACGSAHAQVGGTSISPAMPLGVTSPLGLGPGSQVAPTGIPMGATELASPGVSPLTSGTLPAIGATTTCFSVGGSVSPAAPGTDSSMSGSTFTSGSTTMFDGGGLSGGTSGACAGGASTPMLGAGSASSPTEMGSPSSVSSVGRVGIPLGSTEVGVGGLSPPSVALAPNPIAPLMTLTPLATNPLTSPSTPLPTVGNTTPCPPIGTGTPSINGRSSTFGLPLSGRAGAGASPATSC